MHPVQLISSALRNTHDPDCPDVPSSTSLGLCAITGQEGATVSRKVLLGKSFTDGAALAAPQSDRVSVEAYIALRYKWERMSSWWCDGGVFKRLDRAGVRAAVFGTMPTNNQWAAYATTSYKKHGALRTPVNTGGRRVWLFETRSVDCSDMETVADWWVRLNYALRLGFGRPILETLNCPAFVMAKVGLREWMEFEAWARPRRNAALYAFLCYLLPSQEELKNESLLDTS